MRNIDLIFAKGGLWEDLKRLLKRRRHVRKQNTFCWCPVCKHDLCSNNSLISDTDIVKYLCSNCGCKSVWNFDIAPFPVLMKHQDLSETLKVIL